MAKVGEILTNEQCFKKYPNQWVLLQAVEREGYSITKAEYINSDLSKQEILDEARGRKASGQDVFVICTIESLEDAFAFVAFDNQLINQDYVSPQEYAELFNYYYGLSYAEYPTI